MKKIPNWASSEVSVKGKPIDVENFCKLFVFSEDVDKDDSKKGQKYFARSFIHETWKDFKKEFLGQKEVDFSVDFAWSCWSCMFEGYPNGEECVTLEWACKKYNVEVEIKTEEGGEGFEEKITADKTGANYNSEDMPTHICNFCRNKQLIPSSYDIEEEECMECSRCGFGDKLQKIVEEKLEKIERNKNE